MKKRNSAVVLIGGVIPHLILSLSVVMLSLFILDRFNRAMNFIGNGITVWMIVVWFVLTALLKIIAVYERVPKPMIFLGCLTTGLSFAVLIFIIAGRLGATAARYMIGALSVLDAAFAVTFIVWRRRKSGETVSSGKTDAAPRQ